MPRPSLNILKRTKSRKYSPSLALPGENGEHFENVADCHVEDRLRSRSAFKAAKNLEKRQRKAILKLANKLNYEALKKPLPRSLACSLHMRGKRNAIISQVWRLVDKHRGKVTTATVIKRGWEFTPDELANVDVAKLLNGFLADLNRRGAGQADGWLMAFIHGEYETPSEVIRLHLHMIAAGEMMKVVDKLREGRNYKHRKDDDVRFRVRIDREVLRNLPYPLTYCLKAYWPWKHVALTANGKRRTRKHKRIPEPIHTQVLQFLDRHALNDLVVMKHVSVKQGRLVYSKHRQGG